MHTPITIKQGTPISAIYRAQASVRKLTRICGQRRRVKSCGDSWEAPPISANSNKTYCFARSNCRSFWCPYVAFALVGSPNQATTALCKESLEVGAKAPEERQAREVANVRAHAYAPVCASADEHTHVAGIGTLYFSSLLLP